jgi:hypothetical protein
MDTRLRKKMAETLVLGPLLSMGVYLAQWAYKRHKSCQRNKQYSKDTRALVDCVDFLAEYVESQAQVINHLHQECGIAAPLLCTLEEVVVRAQREVTETLDDKKSGVKLKRQRIEGIHNRMTQTLLVHLGFVMLEV